MKEIKKTPLEETQFEEDLGTPHQAADRILCLNFRGVPLRKVLDHMKEAGGFVIETKTNVALDQNVEAWSEVPLSGSDAVQLLKHVLQKNGCTLVQNGHRLLIMRTDDAKKSYIPIRLPRNHSDILMRGVAARGMFGSTPPPAAWSN